MKQYSLESSIYGTRKKGTRFEALKNIFIENVTAKSIYENLYCCMENSEAIMIKNELKRKKFDVAGVKKLMREKSLDTL